jgi:hypothetical protein
MSRQVTEDDFRMPEFRGADPKDYEIRRGDGKVVRKDRWETSMRSVASAMGFYGREGYELEDVVEAVRKMAAINKTQENVESKD